MVKSVSFMMTLATAAVEDSISMLQQTIAHVQFDAQKTDTSKGMRMPCSTGLDDDDTAIQLAAEMGYTLTQGCVELQEYCDAPLSEVPTSLQATQDAIRRTCPQTCGCQVGSYSGTGDDGNDSCPLGSAQISDAAQCEAVALQLGKPYRGKFESDTYTGGCSDRINHSRYAGIWFNPKLAGSRQGTMTGQVAPVCRVCTKKGNTAVSRNYLEDDGSVPDVDDDGNQIWFGQIFHKHAKHTAAPITHEYDTVSECQERCLAISSCAGFVDNREGEVKYCVFKAAMVTHDNDDKDSWTC